MARSIYLRLSIIVSALGFFVDVYDLLLFSIVRKPSLSAIGLNEAQVLSSGESLISIQMFGMLIGGIVFGILGDKKGRLKVLFGSILLYSVANILNGMVTSLDLYKILRFIAGIGLAGELGAGVTLVSEQLPAQYRSKAAGLIAGFGVLGAVFAFFISKLFDWRICYYIGGILGLFLLIMRLRVKESDLYHQTATANLSRGNFFMFFNDWNRFSKYIRCILIGVPVWFVIGVIVTFSDQFGKAFGIEGIHPGNAIMVFYIGMATGDYFAGWLAESLRSRKKALWVLEGLFVLFLVLFFTQSHSNAAYYYFIIGGLGFGAGLNVIYLTLGIEQFGTNLRATATITISNMVRGSLPLLILLFKYWRNVVNDYVKGALISAILVMIIAMIATAGVEETYGKDLDFVEK